MIANIFDAALQEWIRKGQPHGATHVITKPEHANPALVWPSRVHACPCAHAHERRGDPPRIVPTDTPESAYRKALGHETSRRWADILATAGYSIWTEEVIETPDFLGHLDIVLRDGTIELPIEIKDTGLRMTQGHFWQATTYAYCHPAQQCALILDHRDGSVDLIGIWRDPVDFVAHDLRTGSPATWRGKEIFRLSDRDIRDRLDLHKIAYECEPEQARLDAITHTKCVKVDAKRGTAETICPHWCWSEEVSPAWQVEVRDKEWWLDLWGTSYPVTKGEW